MSSAYYNRAAAKRRHERSLNMNRVRWAADRQRRDRLAEMEPLQYPGQIVLRVVVIRNESAVKEAIVFYTDSSREARRKLAAVMTA